MDRVLQKELWGEGPLALRLIENHVRNYCRRMFAQFEGLSDREDLVFDKDIFEYTHEELGVRAPRWWTRGIG